MCGRILHKVAALRELWGSGWHHSAELCGTKSNGHAPGNPVSPALSVVIHLIEWLYRAQIMGGIKQMNKPPYHRCKNTKCASKIFVISNELGFYEQNSTNRLYLEVWCLSSLWYHLSFTRNSMVCAHFIFLHMFTTTNKWKFPDFLLLMWIKFRQFNKQGK